MDHSGAPPAQPAKPSSAGAVREKAVGALRLLRWMLAAVLALVLLLVFFENSFIYFPTPLADGDMTPAGLAVEQAKFQSADGTWLHGWRVPHDAPRAVVLYMHGNAGNISHRASVLRRLHDELQLDVMIFDYRGYGRSEGSPNETGVLADARAARAWLAARAEVSEQEIVLLGRSLGGAVAVDLAASDGARGLVLESTFSSAADVARNQFFGLPMGWLMRTKYDSAAKIGQYRGPLLASHGTADSLVPHALGRRLFDLANEPKTWIDIADAGHNDAQSSEYYQALADFLDRLPEPTSADVSPSAH